MDLSLSLPFAVSTPPVIPWNWSILGWHLFLVALYGAVGLAFFAVAYLLLDKFTPFSLRKELLEEHNTALAIVLGSVFLGIAIILAAAIHS
jgi:putative membrane protein